MPRRRPAEIPRVWRAIGRAPTYHLVPADDKGLHQPCRALCGQTIFRGDLLVYEVGLSAKQRKARQCRACARARYWQLNPDLAHARALRQQTKAGPEKWSAGMVSA